MFKVPSTASSGSAAGNSGGSSSSSRAASASPRGASMGPPPPSPSGRLHSDYEVRWWHIPPSRTCMRVVRTRPLPYLPPQVCPPPPGLPLSVSPRLSLSRVLSHRLPRFPHCPVAKVLWPLHRQALRVRRMCPPLPPPSPATHSIVYRVGRSHPAPPYTQPCSLPTLPCCLPLPYHGTPRTLPYPGILLLPLLPPLPPTVRP
jgi:hypothetical protein